MPDRQAACEAETHGFAAYRAGRCRCDEGREQHRLRIAERRAFWRTQPLPVGHAAHGTRRGYDHYQCRCQPCRSAKATDRRKGNYADYNRALLFRRNKSRLRKARQRRAGGMPVHRCRVCGWEFGHRRYGNISLRLMEHEVPQGGARCPGSGAIVGVPYP